MREIGCYKTMEQIRESFSDLCNREDIAPTERNFSAYYNGLRIMKFTLL